MCRTETFGVPPLHVIKVSSKPWLWEVAHVSASPYRRLKIRKEGITASISELSLAKSSNSESVSSYFVLWSSWFLLSTLLTVRTIGNWHYFIYIFYFLKSCLWTSIRKSLTKMNSQCDFMALQAFMNLRDWGLGNISISIGKLGQRTSTFFFSFLFLFWILVAEKTEGIKWK